MTVGGITAIVGHNYSIFLKLKGGKGLATAAPVLLFIEPALAGVWIPTFLVTVALTRLMVAGQILGTVAAALVGVFVFPDTAMPVGILSAIIFIKHAPRIKNIINGRSLGCTTRLGSRGRGRVEGGRCFLESVDISRACNIMASHLLLFRSFGHWSSGRRFIAEVGQDAEFVAKEKDD